MDFLKSNIEIVEKKILDACIRSNRKREDVTLIAVSKTKPVGMIEELIHIGYNCFGENKVQELKDKIEVLPNDLEWHLIGHLQTNKVKYIVDKVSLIHSVDSLKLALEIDKEASKKNVIANILIEVNIAHEDTKFGVLREDCLSLVQKISMLKNIKVCGLMTIAPFVDNAEHNRIHFRNLKQLSIDIISKSIDNINMDILSMGMTGDYEVAVEEGATHVRVGTGIFGERNYSV